MDWLTALILSIGTATALILFIMMYFGAKNSKKIDTLDDSLALLNSETKNNLEKVLKSMTETIAQQEQVINRLQNLETIVTSEAWQAIQNKDKREELNHLIIEEQPTELSPDEMAKSIAKKIKY